MKNKNPRAQEKQSEENSLKSIIHRAGYQSVGKDARRPQANRAPEGRGLGVGGLAWWEEHGYSLNLNPSSYRLLGGLKPITLPLTLNCFIFEVEIIGAP